MLLIGSRAIRYHFADFREPRDWDVIGTDEDIARLDEILERSTRHSQRRDKVHYLLGDVMVEVANASAVPYWKLVDEAFRDAPTIEEPSLGTLRVAPAPYLLLTKQCGLIYHIVHWHKNLEDFYYLRDRIPFIPDAVAALLPHALDDSRRMFGANHARAARECSGCHPDLPPPRDADLHALLHERLKLGATTAIGEEGAWDAFPNATPQDRRPKMISLFAEEAMVLAAERFLGPALDEASRDPRQLIRWALRNLITSRLPESWRYFGVNYYRDIAARIPERWVDSIRDLESLRPVCDEPCSAGPSCTR